jgi:hypothetical protein
MAAALIGGEGSQGFERRARLTGGRARSVVKKHTNDTFGERGGQGEVGGWRLEVGGGRLEVGGWRLEVGGRRLEVGGGRWEVGGWGA